MVFIEMETAIVMSLLSLFGFIVILELNNRNWFKRENFKLQKSNILNENKIKLKKLEKELGLNPSKPVVPEKSLTDQIKDLDIEKIKSGLAMVQKPEEDYEYIEEDTKPDIMESVLSYAEQNPEAVKNLMDKVGDVLGGKKEGGKGGHPTQV